MELAGLSVAAHQAGLTQKASVLLMKKVLDQTAQTGEMLNQLLQAGQQMQQSVQSHLGGNLDIRI